MEHQKEQASVLEKKLSADIPNSERGSQHDIRMEFFHRGYVELKQAIPRALLVTSKRSTAFAALLRIDLHEDCLANAYLELGMLPDAITEYQRILNSIRIIL